MVNNLANKIKSFYKRWNISIDEEKQYKEFKNRTLNSVTQILGRHFLYENYTNEFLGIIGHSIVEKDLISSIQLDFKFHDNKVFTILYQENDFVKYIFYLQSLFWIDSIQENIKNELYEGFKNDIECSQLQINLTKTQKEFIFYPVGAKLLDQRIINDVLDWLIDYQSVYNNFRNALEKYNKRLYKRNLIDDLRLSLELLLKNILKNNKSLENQNSNLGTYLNSNGVSSEISNMYWKLIDYYSKYQNNYIKHDDNVKQEEIEFLLYLTGTFIRFLLTINETTTSS